MSLPAGRQVRKLFVLAFGLKLEAVFLYKLNTQYDNCFPSLAWRASW